MLSLLRPSLIRQTLRRLRREKGFSITFLATLGLCIGANIAIFAVIDAILVRSLPFPEADRLVTMINSYPGAGATRSSASLANYFDRRVGLQAYSSLAMYQRGDAIVGEPGSPARIDRDRASPEFFSTLGVKLEKGRTFTEDELLYANAQVAIITDEFWQSYFQRDPNVLGRTFLVDNTPHTVIAILPRGFTYLDSRAKFYVPLASSLEDRAPNRRHSNNVQLIGRLRPGATIEQAQSEINSFNSIQLEDDPHAALLRDANYHTSVFGLHADTVRTVRPVLLLLQGGVLLLLVIGLINLVNLLLIRASARTKEVAVRQALGAESGHLVQETLAETLALAFGGAAVGLVIGAIGIRLMDTLGTNQLPLGAAIGLDGRVIAVSLVGAVVVGVVLSFPILAMHLRRNLATGLQAESRTGTTSPTIQRARHAFIVLQIALAFALLCGAGMLGLSLRKVLGTSPGFSPQSVLTASLSLPWNKYQKDPERLIFVERLLQKLRELPGVSHAAIASSVPFTGDTNDNATAVEGFERRPGESIRTHVTAMATDGYWESLGIPLVEGRFLEAADNHRTQKVCVVDDTFVQRYWPGQSALGRRIASAPTITEENAMTIVGVVGTVKQNDLADTEPLGTVYQPYKLRPQLGFTIVVRTAQAPESLAPALERAVLLLDPQLPLDKVKVAQSWIEDSLVTRKSPALLASVFAAVALLLAAVGTYGVLAYAVNQRRREIGVRLALGAEPNQILLQFLRLGLGLLLVGLLLGTICAFFAGRVMQSVLFNLNGFHPATAAVSALLLATVVFLAIWVPSRRAALVSPMEAIRD